MNAPPLRVVDTDTCIEILRGNARVIERRAAVTGDVATTWTTAVELYLGAANSAAPERNARIVHAFLATLDVLGIDSGSARIFGAAKALLRRMGATPADTICSSRPSPQPAGRSS